MILSDDQLERYARHIVLKEVGGAGQQRLLAAHLLVIGAGGIGSPALQYLAAAGIGRITAVDDDRVDLTNLQRQTLFGSADIGRPKAEAAAERLRSLNPDTDVTVICDRIGPDNAPSLVGDADLVIDGCDNFATRLAVADAAHAARVPLVSAAVAGFEGQLATYRGWEPDQPCYRCLVGGDPALPDRSCADQGVLGALAGVMGSLAALEAIRQVAGFGEDQAGRLLLVDALPLRFRSVRIVKDLSCATCGG